MSKYKKSIIEVQGTDITILSQEHGDYISLTDMVRNFEGGSALIEQWLKNKDTVLFLGAWERIHNPDFNSLEFEGIRNEAGRNSFFLSAKTWIDRTRAKGLTARAGRYGGTYAHRDIAFEFGSWLSPEFKLYLIKEFQRLKDDESRRLSLAWNLNRTLSKLNYRIHTDAVKAHLIPPEVTPAQAAFTYASEADPLVFAQLRKQFPAVRPEGAATFQPRAERNSVSREAPPWVGHSIRVQSPERAKPATARGSSIGCALSGLKTSFVTVTWGGAALCPRLTCGCHFGANRKCVETSLRSLEPRKGRKE